MDFTFTAEQVELGKIVRSFLAEHASEQDLRRAIEGDRGWDRKTWLRLAQEMGVQGLAIPEEYGGSGFGLLELGVVFEELGRVLFPGPFLSSIGLAATLLLATGDEPACADLLPGIAAGHTVATLALTEECGCWTEDAVTTRAQHGPGGWTVSGTKAFVLDGPMADLLLVVARSSQGVGVFAVASSAKGVAVSARPTLDVTRRQARVDLRDAPARLVGSDGRGWPAVERALRVGAVLLAAEQVGGAAAVLDMAVEYATTRHQFGRAIGSFQSVKHKAADMLLRLEAARSAAQYALWAAATDGAELPAAASLAKVYCSEAYTHCAEANLQIHGGIGFTWEHRAHLYLRRAKSAQTLLGSPTFHRERVLALAGM